MKTYRVVRVRATSRGLDNPNMHPSLADASPPSEELERQVNLLAEVGWEVQGSPWAEGVNLCVLMVRDTAPVCDSDGAFS